MLTQTLHIGDRVSWSNSQGRSTGKIVKELTRSTKAESFQVKASKDDPHYLVESEDTGARAAHRPEALRKLSSRR